MLYIIYHIIKVKSKSLNCFPSRSSVGFLHIKIVRQAVEDGAEKFILGLSRSSDLVIVVNRLNLLKLIKPQFFEHFYLGMFRSVKYFYAQAERQARYNCFCFCSCLYASVHHNHIILKTFSSLLYDFSGQFSQPFESVPSMVQFYRENKLPVRGNESLFLTKPLTAGRSWSLFRERTIPGRLLLGT